MSNPFLKNKNLVVPTVLWVLFLVVFLIAFQTGPSKYYSILRTLIQWDGQHYLSIARDGYEKFPCGFNPSYICGNVGWFPFYPMLGRLVALTGLDHRITMLAVSWLALWMALILLYRLVARKYGNRAALAGLVSLLLFPGAFYLLTAFPYAVFLLLSVWAIYLLDTGRYAWLALPCALLAITYPSGAVVGLPITWVIVTRWRTLTTANKLHLWGALLAIGLALLLYSLYYWWQFDDFFLYLHSKSYYGHRLTFPLWMMAHALANLPAQSPVFVALVFAITATALFWTRRIPGAWQVFMFGLLLFTPTFGTTLCYYRHVVVAWPLFMMVGVAAESRYRRFLLPLYALTSVYLTWQVYLPLYKAGRLM